MSVEKKWQFELEEYIKQGEPDQAEKSEAWQIETQETDIVSANIWQIHPFCEGNTRATAVFIIKYMRTFGLKVENDAFKKHSWYFRNALVRANYNNLKNGFLR